MEDSTKMQNKEEQKQKDQKNNNKKDKNELVIALYIVLNSQKFPLLQM